MPGLAAAAVGGDDRLDAPDVGPPSWGVGEHPQAAESNMMARLVVSGLFIAV
jgi:hypothetical protein